MILQKKLLPVFIRKTAAIVLGAIGFALTGDVIFSQFSLTAVPGLPGVFSGSVAWADFDNDGRMDFVLSGSGGSNGAASISFWHNTGSGFSNVTSSVAPDMPGIADSSVAWGDFDNDGRVDLLITGLTNSSESGAISQVWRNSTNGFVKVPIIDLPGVAGSSVAWGDFDKDGRLDFLITGTSNGLPSGVVSQLWRNTGAGFTNVPIPGLAGVSFGSVAWGDFDNDGRPDFLITGHGDGLNNDAISQIWRNTGDGFTNVPISGLTGVFVSFAAWGDFNHDGRLDFLLSGLSTNGFITQIWQNTGTGFINAPVPGLPGIADGSLAWGDFDNDGRIDFLLTGLNNNAAKVSQVWRNTDGGFTNVPIPDLPGNFDNSVAWGDFDNDGRLDFLVAGTTEGGSVSQLWHNDAPASNSPPAAPGGLVSAVSGTTVFLKWNPLIIDNTPAAGLSYNVRIGTSPGASDIVSAPALANGALLIPQMGSARNGLTAFHQLTPGKTYYWSVQAVDSGFVGSPFAVEQQFTVAPLLVNPVQNANGLFEFSFTSTPGANFIVLGTTNVSLALSNWTVLGAVTEVSPGHFQFIDSQTANSPQRFYHIRSP